MNILNIFEIKTYINLFNTNLYTYIFIIKIFKKL